MQLGEVIAEILVLQFDYDLRAMYIHSESPLRTNQIKCDASME